MIQQDQLGRTNKGHSQREQSTLIFVQLVTILVQMWFQLKQLANASHFEHDRFFWNSSNLRPHYQRNLDRHVWINTVEGGTQGQ